MADGKIRAAAVVQQSFEEHNAQLYLALGLLCKGSALVTVKQQRSPTSTDAVLVTAETCRVDSTDD